MKYPSKTKWWIDFHKSLIHSSNSIYLLEKFSSILFWSIVYMNEKYSNDWNAMNVNIVTGIISYLKEKIVRWEREDTIENMWYGRLGENIFFHKTFISYYTLTNSLNSHEIWYISRLDSIMHRLRLIKDWFGLFENQ